MVRTGADRTASPAERISAPGRPAAVLRRLGRDARGTTAVEFGLLIVPFMLTLLGVFEVGYTFFMLSALDSAARGSARAVMTGAVSTAGMNAATFRTSVVCPKLPANFDCNSVFTNVTVVPGGTSPTGYYSYVDAAQSALLVPQLNASANTFCPGSGGQYVVVQILYPANFFTGLFAGRSTTTYQGKKVNVLMSTATFKAEPYSGAAAYSGC
ncbi:TadE/TadG family type IV pilus assembly protein [Methylobacterium sp. J-076]|uniref:TadE/TadG family type IV pilus assembly protein n=1 Tax=Methylobacterium sp. J-076 TaxID=2836655 RepID=UPI001FB9ADAD|nr:TadE/TadG family type IV pilus assembly protein [Methylobacterium sp. J-076]MCJ2013437.1 pilus assembly protein [Methylobacterium sp. J-076]